MLRRAEQEVYEVSVLGGAENVYEVSMAEHEQLIRIYTTVNSCKMSAEPCWGEEAVAAGYQ